MSLLDDIVGEAFFGGLGELIAELRPWVRHMLTGLAGTGFAIGIGAVIATWPRAADRPGWTIGLAIVSLLYGLLFGAVSAVTLVNDPYDRLLVLFALLGCTAATALPVTMMAL
jgi:hypothetical protein